MDRHLRSTDGRFAGSAPAPAPTPAPTRPTAAPTGPAGISACLSIDAAYERFTRRTWNPDDDLLDRYTNSDCWILALATHRQTGWPLVAVADEAVDQDGTPTDDYARAHAIGWIHLAVMTPDGNVLDVHGTRSPGDVLEAFDQMADDPDMVDLVPVDCRRVATYLSLGPDEATSEQTTHANLTATDLLAAVHPEPHAGCPHH